MDTPHNSKSNTPEEIDAEIERELAQALGDSDMEQILAGTMTPPPKAPPETPPEGSTPPDSTRTAPGASDTGSDPHKMVRGRIAGVQRDDVFVDLHGIDGKNQGIVPLSQFERPPRPGSIMDFVIERHDPSQGWVILSREGAVSRTTWDQLRRGSVVEARVVATNKGGLELELIGGVRAFMPASQVGLHYVEDLESFVGQKLRARVQEINRASKKIVLSRRQDLESQRQAKQAQLWEEIQVGQTRQGTVSGVMDYGVFVDLGGTDGLIHVSDISHSRVDKPSDTISVGQEVTVKVLSIDKEKQRIGLGMKQTEPDPWRGIADRLRPGDYLSVRVVRAVDFGAFVEVEPGVEGLVPISELSWKRIGSPTEVIEEGDVIRLVVLSIDPEQHRISLSLKQAMGDPWVGAEHKYPKDNLVDAQVRSITDFGAFVELEQGVEALVHISELSDRRVNCVEDVLQIGQRQQFRVLDVDETQRRMRVSLKAVAAPAQDPGVSLTKREAHKMRQTKAGKKPAKPLKGGIE